MNNLKCSKVIYLNILSMYSAIGFRAKKCVENCFIISNKEKELVAKEHLFCTPTSKLSSFYQFFLDTCYLIIHLVNFSSAYVLHTAAHIYIFSLSFTKRWISVWWTTWSKWERKKYDHSTAHTFLLVHIQMLNFTCLPFLHNFREKF